MHRQIDRGAEPHEVGVDRLDRGSPEIRRDGENAVGADLLRVARKLHGVFHRKGAWHGFRNTSSSEEAEMIWGWAGAASRAEAGYELRYPPR